MRKCALCGAVASGGYWQIERVERLTEEQKKKLSEDHQEKPWHIVLVCRECAIPDWVSEPSDDR